MQQEVTARAPAHLWIVGILSLLWNGYGSTDYLMTRMRNTDWLSQGGADPHVMLAWVDSFPIYAQFGWGLGVWMGLLGSILLLFKSRWATWAFALSLIGAVVGLGYQIMLSPPPPPMNEGAFALIPYVIILVAAGLLAYAYSMEKKGVLR